MTPIFSRSVSKGGAALAIALLACLVGGCPAPSTDPSPTPMPTAVALTPEETADPILPSPSPSPSGTTPATESKTLSVYRVVAGVGDKRAHLEASTVPLKEGANAAVAALNYMAQAKDTPLPKGTRAQSVKMSGELATVNFNRAFADNFAGEIGGDEREALIFNAITATLGQFKGVKQVQILVDGKKVPLGGTQDTTEPLPIADAPGTKVSLRP